MKIIRLLFSLGISGTLVAGEVQWGGSSSFKGQEDKEYPTKNLEFKEFDMNSFGDSKGQSSFFDKAFTTKSFTLYDKEYNFGGKEFVAPTLDFNKQFATKDLDFNSKASPYSQKSSSSFKFTDAPWASRQVAPGFDKQVEMKEYTGPEAQLVKRDIAEIYKTLNSMKNIPDHDLTIDEVRDLVNKDHGPALKFTEPPRPGQATATPQDLSKKTPLQ